MGRAEELFERIIAGGQVAIDEFITTRTSEELFLEFKRSADNGNGIRLHQHDRDHLAKAISGFGNSEGGVIIWGIDCSRTTDNADVAHTRVPIVNPTRFKSWLEGVVSACTVPAHSGVRHHAIPVDANNGYVVTLIPTGYGAPYQAIYKKQYFIRAGSDFAPTPHEVLAGLFGRRPQPHVFYMYSVSKAVFDRDAIKVSLGVKIANNGPGIADNMYLNIMCLSVPGDTCEISLEPTDKNWGGYMVHEMAMNLIANVGVRLAPEAQHQPLVIHVALAPPFTRDLHIKGMCGAGNSPPYRFEFRNSSQKILELHALHMASYSTSKGNLSNEQRHAITAEMFNLEIPQNKRNQD